MRSEPPVLVVAAPPLPAVAAAAPNPFVPAESGSIYGWEGDQAQHDEDIAQIDGGVGYLDFSEDMGMAATSDAVRDRVAAWLGENTEEERPAKSANLLGKDAFGLTFSAVKGKGRGAGRKGPPPPPPPPA